MNKKLIKVSNALSLTEFKHIFKVMKLTSLFGVLCVSSAFAVNVNSQSLRVNIHANQKQAKEVIKQIEEQTDYLFVYNHDKVNLNNTVTIQANNETVAEVLNQMFAGTDIIYAMQGNNILLMQKDAVVQQSGKVVTGTIVDPSGMPVIGANVMVKGTTNGTITDMDGKFSLEVEEGATLQISYIGYANQEIKVGNQKTLSIALKEDAEALDELVVVGYGTQKKVNLTGAVAQVGSKLIENRSITNLGQALQGQIANLNVTLGSGDPGTGAEYNIRGTTSLSGGSPLVIIDGVPDGNLNMINPNDIESVSVLKDAASSAIYGARAAYGVILVKTKSGKKNTKIQVSYGGTVSRNSPLRIPNQVNSLDFAEAYNIASINAGQAPMFTEEHIERIKAFMADPEHTPSNVPNPSNPNYWSYATLDNDNVDWMRTFFKPSYLTQKHDISVNGGNDKSSFYVGAGFYDQGGLLRYADESYKRLNLISNLHFEPYKWLSGDLRASFVKDDKNTISNAYDGDIGSWMHLATTRFPNWSLKDPNGHWASTSHIYKQLDGGRGITQGNILTLTGALQITPLAGWKINGDYTYRRTDFQSRQHSKPVIWEYTVDEQPVMTTQFDSYSTGINTTNYYSLNLYSSYEKKIQDHYFSALIGYQQEYTKQHDVSANKRELISQEIPSIGVAVGDQNTGENLSHWANMGYFMRFNYNYKEKYLIEFNGRYDGSSKFPKGHRFGFFPSFSVGYNIAKEEFWPLKDKVENLKLRASWGSLGNQSVANYLYLATVGIGTKYGYIINGVLPNTLGTPGLISPDLTWETSNTLDFGFDMSFLSNRLNLSFDWYNRKTIDMFGPAEPVPAVIGVGLPQQNNADLSTKGFELAINWRDRIGDDFDYSLGFVLSDNKSKITRYNNPNNLIDTYYVGKDLHEIWGYETDRMIQTDEDLANMPDQSVFYGHWQKGDIMYKDLDGDGKITYGKRIVGDTGDYKVIGNSNPRFAFGLSASATWKGFDLNLFFQGVGKRDFAPDGGNSNGTLFWGIVGGWGSNMYEETMDFWTEENTDAYYPRPYNSSETAKNQVVQTRYLQNAAYIRLKNLQLGYTIPKDITSKIRLQKIRFFVNGENLFTITGLHKNFDPESLYYSWGNGKAYPMTRSIAFGINVDF